MNCDEALLVISAALDGELSPAERLKLSEHLLECESCRVLAEDLRILTDELGCSDREAPPGLADAIRRAVAEEAQAPAAPKKRPPYLRAVAAMLALCVGLGGIGLFAGRRTGNDSAGAAPAMFQAAPENRAYSAAPEGAPEADSYGAAGDGSAPMEAEESSPDPEMPGMAPASVAADGGSYKDQSDIASSSMTEGGEMSGGSGPSSDGEGADPDSACPPPDAVITFRRLPEGWEELFPGVATVDAMLAPVGEARAFVQLLEDQGITYEIALSDAAELSGLDDNSQCQLLLTETD